MRVLLRPLKKRRPDVPNRCMLLAWTAANFMDALTDSFFGGEDEFDQRAFSRIRDTVLAMERSCGIRAGPVLDNLDRSEAASYASEGRYSVDEAKKYASAARSAMQRVLEDMRD